MKKPNNSIAPRPRILSANALAETRGGSLNAYFSKVVGEKQGAFEGGVLTPPPPPPPPK